MKMNHYYSFGMLVPNGNGGNDDYRYAYQGQVKDPETGKEAFGLRLWDSRIGRWLTTDPKGQYSSPYLGMGNNPINGIDPDGGNDYKLNKKTGGLTEILTEDKLLMKIYKNNFESKTFLSDLVH